MTEEGEQRSEQGGGLLAADALPQRLLDRAAPLAADLVAGKEQIPDVATFNPLETVIWSMRRSVRSATGAEELGGVLGIVYELPRLTGEVRLAFVAWVDLVEELVQASESRHAKGSGNGSVKYTEVRKSIEELLAADALDAVPVPAEVRPLLRGPMTVWVIDSVVYLANEYGLWRDPEPDAQKSEPRRWLRVVLAGPAAVLGVAARVVRPVADGLERAAKALRLEAYPDLTLEGSPLGSSDDPMPARERPLIPRIEQLAVALANGRATIVPAVSLIGYAVQLAASRDDLGGSAKRAFASDLVMLTLADMALGEDEHVDSAVIEMLVGLAVEATAFLFAKRGISEPW